MVLELLEATVIVWSLPNAAQSLLSSSTKWSELTITTFLGGFSPSWRAFRTAANDVSFSSFSPLLRVKTSSRHKTLVRFSGDGFIKGRPILVRVVGPSIPIFSVFPIIPLIALILGFASIIRCFLSFGFGGHRKPYKVFGYEQELFRQRCCRHLPHRDILSRDQSGPEQDFRFGPALEHRPWFHSASFVGTQLRLPQGHYCEYSFACVFLAA